jgi:hypothetical protein
MAALDSLLVKPLPARLVRAGIDRENKALLALAAE